MKKSIWILLVLTASLALVPSRTLAQDAPTDSAAEPATEPTEAPAEEGTAPDAVPAAEGDAAEGDSETTESETVTVTSEGSELSSPTATAVQTDVEAEAAAAAEEEAAPEEAPAAAPGVPLFRGSMFSWTQGVSAATMDQDLLLTYNPSYYWSFFFQPRLNFDAQNFLVLSLGMSIEWTNSDYTNHDREPVLSDTSIEYRHLERWEGFIFLPSVRLTAPTSLPSIAQERILALGAGLTVVRVFPELASLTVALTGRYTHWFGLSNVPTTIDNSSPFMGQGGLAFDQVSGFTIVNDSILGALTVTVMPLPGLTVTTQYAFNWGFRLGATDAPIVGPDNSSRYRNAQYFTLAVAYDVQPWLNVSLGYQTAPGFARVGDDLAGGGFTFNERVNPFWDQAQSEVYLSVTVPLDALYEAIAPSDTEEQLTPEQLQRRRQGLARSSSPELSF